MEDQHKEQLETYLKEGIIPEIKQEPRYEWSEDVTFSISGREMEHMFKTFQAYLSQPKAQEVIAIAHCMDIMSVVFEKGIEEGVIVDRNKAE